MKKVLLLLSCFFGLALADNCPPAEPFKPLSADKAATIMESSLAETFSTYQKSRLPVMVNFWAIWCPPCRKELPFLQDLQKRQSATVKLINIDYEADAANQALQSLGIDQLTTDFAAAELLDELKIAGLPASVVFHSDKVYLGVGILKDEDAIANWLACLPKTIQQQPE
ncbi:MAG: hypothetical protein CR962_00305 [Gammaproteobacteria bacterium]|nr:MAG: hypothetical protein CR962_00305 [Gammaproteobacteria bacterium]